MSPGGALVWVLILTPIYLALVVIFTTLENLMDFARLAAKAIAGAIVAGVASFAAAAGFDLTDAQTSALTLFLTGLVVYLVPNKQAAE